MDKYLTLASGSTSGQKRKGTLQQKYPWIARRIDSNNEPEMYCIWCTDYNKNSMGAFVVGTKKFKKDYLDTYLTTKEHQKAAYVHTGQPSDQTKLVVGFTIQANINKLDVIAKMRCIYLCAKKHLAIDTFSNIIELLDLQEKNKTELVFDQPPITLLPSSIGPKRDLITSNDLENQTNYSTYKNPMAGAEFLHAIATVIEESVLKEVRKSPSKHMAENIPILRYLGLIELLEIDANAIMNNLNNFFIAKMLNTDNLMHFGSDGASVMLGKKNGVSTKLQTLNPFLTNCHYIAHRLNLAGKDAAKDVLYFEDYEVTLKELYAYFDSSHQRWQHLKMFQNLVKDDPQLSILCIVSTRWLSLSNTVSNLHQIIFSIIDALDDDANNNSSIDSITTEFIGNGDDPDDIDYILPTFGNHLRNYMFELNIEPDVLPIAFKEFAIALVNNLYLRFPDTGIYNAMKIFDFSQVPTKSNAMVLYGEHEIKILGDFYGSSKYQNGQAFPAKVNKTRLIQEWREAKLFLKNYHDFDFIDGWRRIFTNSQFSTLYPNLSEVVNYSLIVPLSNGNVERIFSHQNLIKTKVHNKMKLKTLNSHLIIVMNGPKFKDFDFEKAFDIWQRFSRRINK
ncbi:zinc finger protein 862-like [Rhizophagus clarus]|uniref:Zinc finger protein 862-like n=2 Tax=Rhizophagus clarus TaxID=94130 RepID=A0A8H3M1X8_9GLOM|nr:zinc finger protein 862-like [Rhizophagus clarus]